jgi:hypothetical protein
MNKTSHLLLAALLVPAVSFAQVTQLATPATVSGGHSTSANYTLDSAIDPMAAPTATSASYISRPGFVGQLYEVTALTLTATPSTTVDETKTTQLAAGATLDDGTLLVPDPQQVKWAVVSGPVTSVAADGTATAGTVSVDTPATVSGSYLGKTSQLVLTVRNVPTDDFASWQVDNFGPGAATDPQAAATADPDNDGQNNQMEFLAGTLPKNAASVFTVRIQSVPGQPTHKSVVFGPVIAGRTYRVLASTNLAATSWPDISGPLTSSNVPFTDTAATGARKFYRVQISKP